MPLAPGAHFRLKTDLARNGVLQAGERIFAGTRRVPVQEPDGHVVWLSLDALEPVPAAGESLIDRIASGAFVASDWLHRTGVAEPRLLRASHIKPWAQCETDAERLDVHSGLLLAADLDAASDVGLISFADDGSIVFAACFFEADRIALGLHNGLALKRLSTGHGQKLAWHREHVLQIVGPETPTTGSA